MVALIKILVIAAAISCLLSGGVQHRDGEVKDGDSGAPLVTLITTSMLWFLAFLRLFIPYSRRARGLFLLLIFIIAMLSLNQLELMVVSALLIKRMRRGWFSIFCWFWWAQRALYVQRSVFDPREQHSTWWFWVLCVQFLAMVFTGIIGMQGLVAMLLQVHKVFWILALAVGVWRFGYWVLIFYLPVVNAQSEWMLQYVMDPWLCPFIAFVAMCFLFYFWTKADWKRWILFVVSNGVFCMWLKWSIFDVVSLCTWDYLMFYPERKRWVSACVVVMVCGFCENPFHLVTTRLHFSNLFWWMPRNRYDFQWRGMNFRQNRQLCPWTYAWLTGIALPCSPLLALALFLSECFGLISPVSVSSAVLSLLHYGKAGMMILCSVLRCRSVYSQSIIEHEVGCGGDHDIYYDLLAGDNENGFYRETHQTSQPGVVRNPRKVQSDHLILPNGRYQSWGWTDWIRTGFGILTVGGITATELQQWITAHLRVKWITVTTLTPMVIMILRVLVWSGDFGYYPTFFLMVLGLVIGYLLPPMHEMIELAKDLFGILKQMLKKLWYKFFPIRIQGEQDWLRDMELRILALQIQDRPRPVPPVGRPATRRTPATGPTREDYLNYQRDMRRWEQEQADLQLQRGLRRQVNMEIDEMVADSELFYIEQHAFQPEEDLIGKRKIFNPWIKVFTVVFVIMVTLLKLPTWILLLIMVLSLTTGVHALGVNGEPTFDFGQMFDWFKKQTEARTLPIEWYSKFEEALFSGCDWKCRLIQLSGQIDLIVCMALFITFLFLYLRFVHRMMRNYWFTWCLLLVHMIGLYLSTMGHVCLSLVVVLLSGIAHMFGIGLAFDIMSWFGVHFPFVCVIMGVRLLLSWDSIWYMWFKWDLLSFMLVVLLTGMFIGFMAACELRSTSWGKGKIIIERDAATGRILSRREDFGFFGNVVFGVCFGDVGGCAPACLGQMIASQVHVQKQCVLRFLSPGLNDGTIDPKFVKKMLKNAHGNGTLEEFLEAVNEGKPIPEAALITMKATIDPSCFGVVCIGGKPMANGTCVRVGTGNMLMCNLHTVIQPQCMDDVFNKFDDTKVKLQEEITWNNGRKIFVVKPVSWCARSDVCLCTGVTGIDGLALGPYVVGKPLCWMGCAPPLTTPGRIFCMCVKPNPFGCVKHNQSELGDSGSILVDSCGRAVAMKYGVQCQGGKVSDLSYFVQVGQLSMMNLQCPGISSSSLIDMKQAVEDEDYKGFCLEFMQMSDEAKRKAAEYFERRDHQGLSSLLEEMSKVRNFGLSVQQLLTGVLGQIKSKDLIHKDELSRDQQYLLKRGQMAAVEDRMKQIKILISEHDVDEGSKILKEKIKKLQAELNRLQTELREQYPPSDEEKQLNKTLGDLGLQKYQLKLEIRKLEDSGCDDEMQEKKQQLRDVNKALSQHVGNMDEVKLMVREIIESRMPKGLGGVRYPFFYQNDDRTWTVHFSPDEAFTCQKHPVFTEDVMSRHEEFGFTKSQWRKKLQNCQVTKQWYLMVHESNFGGKLCHWVLKEFEFGCPYSIYCQHCGWHKVCDKALHVGCSKELCESLERHLGNCGSNVQFSDGDILVNGVVMGCEDGKLTYCGNKCECEGKCILLKDNIDPQKTRLTYKVNMGSFCVWLKRKCVHDLVKKSKDVDPGKDFTKLLNKFDQVKQTVLGVVRNVEQLQEHVVTQSQVVNSLPTHEDVQKMISNSRPTSRAPSPGSSHGGSRCVSEASASEGETDYSDVERSKPQRRRRSHSKVRWQEDVSSGLEYETPIPRPRIQPIEKSSESQPKREPREQNEPKQDRAQLFISNQGEQHSKLVGDCNCPRCCCEKGCECAICSGTACIWCNCVGHSTKTCLHAKARKCRECGGPYGDWFGKCMYDPKQGKFGTDQVCCTKAKKCVICYTSGHHSLSCPVVRHSTFSKPRDTVNCHGLNPEILDSMLLPPWDSNERRREMPQKKAKKERRNEDF